MNNSLINENVNLRSMSTFRCGGDARYFASPKNSDEVLEALKFAEDEGLEVFVLGAGSNILVSDEGFDGLVIKIGKDMAELSMKEDGEYTYVKAGAGLSLASFGNACYEAGLEGAEFACGIPGSVGGGVFMNAGAYGGEIKNIAYNVTFILDGKVKTIMAEDAGFGYRASIFERLESEGKKPIIIGFTARLKKGNKEEILGKMTEYRDKRKASQPLDVPSAGSTFKRPEGYFAGKLIEDSGFRGFALDESGAQVSPKHCGFVVNNGGKANAADVYKLIMYVSDKVYEDSGVRLVPEVRFVGKFN